MAIKCLSELNSYQISDLVDEVQSVKNLVNTKLPLTGGTITGNLIIYKNNPYVVQRNKLVPNNAFTDLPDISSEYKYTGQGVLYHSGDDKRLGGTVNECVHDSNPTASMVDFNTVFNYIDLPISKFPKVTPNGSDSTIGTKGIMLRAILKANGRDPYCEAFCSVPYRNDNSGSEIVVQSWIRKNLTGLDRIAPDSTILWYNNATYNVRFAQDGDSYDSSKARPWIGYSYGNLYLKEAFTNFNRLYIIFADDSARYISTCWIDTYDLDLRMKSYFYPYGSNTPLFLGVKNGVSTTESGNATFCELFSGFGTIYWRIFGYNTHLSDGNYKSTTTCLRHEYDNGRILCIIGVGRKTQTTWNP